MKILKSLFVLLVLSSAPFALAASYQDLRDDIEDLRNDIWMNEMYRRIEKLNEQNASGRQPAYKRKYANGNCKLMWVNGTGLVEIAKEVKGYAVYALESDKRQGIFAELYIDKSYSKESVETLMQTQKNQIYQMCK